MVSSEQILPELQSPVNYERVLFLAHREEILNQAYETFAKVRGIEDLGKLFEGQFDYESLSFRDFNK